VTREQKNGRINSRKQTWIERTLGAMMGRAESRDGRDIVRDMKFKNKRYKALTSTVLGCLVSPL
jgi:hypothetical protein